MEGLVFLLGLVQIPPHSDAHQGPQDGQWHQGGKARLEFRLGLFNNLADLHETFRGQLILTVIFDGILDLLLHLIGDRYVHPVVWCAVSMDLERITCGYRDVRLLRGEHLDSWDRRAGETILQ